MSDKGLAGLVGRFGHLAGEALLRALLEGPMRGRMALVSSFGAESAVLLHMVAGIDRSTPVIFLDTGKLFGETRRYRDQLVERLALTDLRIHRPNQDEERVRDPDGLLWRRDADACCGLRKVAPLGRALETFDGWITGRKRWQSASRTDLPGLEIVDGRLKANPLAGWSRDQLGRYLDTHGLPRHPLEADGYLSIGCMPCTDRVAAEDDPRSGRWRGLAKTECGIHLPATAGGVR